jgi:hypothetical protein
MTPDAAVFEQTFDSELDGLYPTEQQDSQHDDEKL